MKGRSSRIPLGSSWLINRFVWHFIVGSPSKRQEVCTAPHDFAEVKAVTGVMDVSQLPQTVVHKIGLSVLQGNGRQASRHARGTLPATEADMMLVHLDTLLNPETGNAEFRVPGSLSKLFFAHKWQHFESPRTVFFTEHGAGVWGAVPLNRAG
jgi:hypothetical protein